MKTYHKIPIEKLCYFAGLLDGEGCIRIAKIPSLNKKHKYDYIGAVQMGSTSENMLKWVKENIGGNYYGSVNETVKSKMSYNWMMSHGGNITLLEQLLPYLIIKKEQAECFIKFAETLTRKYGRGGLPTKTIAYREERYQEMKKLNKKGPAHALIS